MTKSRSHDYIVGMSKINKTLATRARDLADDIWAEGKLFEKYDQDTARQLKNISGKIHMAASDLERFAKEIVTKITES